jgi:Effector-associated domain 11
MTFDSILALIENDELESAIDTLKAVHRNTKKYRDVVLVSAWYNEFQRNANIGALSYEQTVMEKNRIRRSLLELLPDEKPAGNKTAPALEPASTAGAKAGSSLSKYVKQVKLKLFEGGDECPPIGERIYGTSFSKTATRYIWWEVEVICLPPEEDLPFDLTFFYYDEQGNVLGGKGYHHPMRYPAGQTVWLYWWGWGYVNPGKWQDGKYRAEVYADQFQLAVVEFVLS